MVSLIVERKQSNGRYAPYGNHPCTDTGFIYKSLATALYRHSLCTKANRIKAVRLDDNTMRFTVTYPDGQWRSIYTVDNLGWR